MHFTTLSEWLSWQQTLHPSAIDLGLTRIQRTLDRLGWRRPACPVITVGGTNGKGSSVALLGCILAEAGYRVGAFTSPHLLRYNERITIADREVSDASLVAAFERIDAARGDDTLTFFEFNALAALLIFESARPDVIVLEVGMGGRLDAVNVVDADVALVTSVALDHCEWLGRDVETIGREKAGIFRRDRPAVFGSRVMPASIATSARDIGARLLQLGRDFSYVRSAERWSWRGVALRLDDLPPPALVGDIQFDNAAAVLAVLETLADRLPVPAAAVVQGLQRVQVAGRFQQLDRNGVHWILDVAHNPAAARTLASQLAARGRDGQTIAVCGILGDKDAAGIAGELRASFDRWIVTGLDSDRAVDPQLLAQRLRTSGIDVTDVVPDVGSACSLAAALAGPGDSVVVFGSFLTVAPALLWLGGSLASAPHF
ncbi:MAG TPA: bifunctional tetrahydrofolate synthase/dihydrofolate synthase [Povalibacter sp.]|nr:bifunctional tetrahydrofolate synthase/dihydrofolate synthase [Povalibacter sp.]